MRESGPGGGGREKGEEREEEKRREKRKRDLETMEFILVFCLRLAFKQG